MSANFTPNLGQYTDLTPFRYWCQKVLPLVYDDSLSYYELLNKVVDCLNKTMEDVETLHGDVEGLHAAYVLLQQYVNEYLNNLNLQPMIDNKLDEMAADGTLAELVDPYIDQIVDSITDIRHGVNFYGAETSYETTENGDYWLVKIPRYNVNGDLLSWKVGISDGTITDPWTTDPQTVRALSVQKKASFAVNGGFAQRANNLIPWGSVISDGVLLLDQYDTHTTGNYTLGIMEDGSWRYYDSHTVAGADMLADGAKQAVAGLGPIIHNGAKTAQLTDYNSRYGGGRWQTIGYNDDNLFIVTSEGGAADIAGLTLDGIANIYVGLNALEAYVLDSGGSTSTNLESVKLNSNKDDNGTTDRKVATFLYIRKADIATNPNYAEDVSFSRALGLLTQNFRASAAHLKLYKLSSADDNEFIDCNDLPINSVGYTYPVSLNSPDGAYWHIFTYGYSNSLKVQIAIRHTDERVMFRSCVSGNWRPWVEHVYWSFPATVGSTVINDLPIYSVYLTSGSNANKPDSGRWLITTMGPSRTSQFRYQIAIKESGAQIATRYRKSDGTWDDWSFAVSNDTLKAELGDTVTVSINAENTQTLADQGIITAAGYYYVIITRSGDTADSGSVYIIRYSGSTFSCKTDVHQSALASGPKLSAGGVITPVSSTANQTYYARAIKIH